MFRYFIHNHYICIASGIDPCMQCEVKESSVFPLWITNWSSDISWKDSLCTSCSVTFILCCGNICVCLLLEPSFCSTCLIIYPWIKYIPLLRPPLISLKIFCNFLYRGFTHFLLHLVLDSWCHLMLLQMASFKLCIVSGIQK